jgi:hypothetical protein
MVPRPGSAVDKKINCMGPNRRYRRINQSPLDALIVIKVRPDLAALTS